eukprot:768660-Hanusia_phi.AAC.4
METLQDLSGKYEPNARYKYLGSHKAYDKRLEPINFESEESSNMQVMQREAQLPTMAQKNEELTMCSIVKSFMKMSSLKLQEIHCELMNIIIDNAMQVAKNNMNDADNKYFQYLNEKAEIYNTTKVFSSASLLKEVEFVKTYLVLFGLTQPQMYVINQGIETILYGKGVLSHSDYFDENEIAKIKDPTALELLKKIKSNAKDETFVQGVDDVLKTFEQKHKKLPNEIKLEFSDLNTLIKDSMFYPSYEKSKEVQTKICPVDTTERKFVDQSHQKLYRDRSKHNRSSSSSQNAKKNRIDEIDELLEDISPQPLANTAKKHSRSSSSSMNAKKNKKEVVPNVSVAKEQKKRLRSSSSQKSKSGSNTDDELSKLFGNMKF